MQFQTAIAIQSEWHAHDVKENSVQWNWGKKKTLNSIKMKAIKENEWTTKMLTMKAKQKDKIKSRIGNENEKGKLKEKIGAKKAA